MVKTRRDQLRMVLWRRRTLSPYVLFLSTHVLVVCLVLLPSDRVMTPVARASLFPQGSAAVFPLSNTFPYKRVKHVNIHMPSENPIATAEDSCQAGENYSNSNL